MKNLFDAHNHCQFSFDGKKTTVELSSKAAYEKGLGGIVFTDHCDIFVPQECMERGSIQPQDFDIAAQQAEIDRVQEMFGNKLRILKGIEIGMNHSSRDEINGILATHSFDQVIASIHYLEDTDPYYGGFFVGRDWKNAYGTYLETIYNEMTALKDFDIIGHYDYVARYAPYPVDSIRYGDFSDIFDTIFLYLIENGKGLEINTKSCKGGHGKKTVLDHNVLLRYRELGGEIISLGSDSHAPANVAESFAENAAMLRSLGFSWSSHYEKRQLIQKPL
jgi:histidinol-phosphatase (PHP family)